MKRRFLVLCAVLLSVVGCGATATLATSSPPQSASSAPAAPAIPVKASTYNLAIGDTIDMSNSTTGDKWTVTVNSIKKFTSDNEFETPNAGMQFIVIDVTYAVKAGTATSNPFDWEAKDPTGSVSPRTMVSETLPASTVEAPNNVRGTVVLQIPVGSAGTVVYSAGLSERASWAFTAADIT